MGAENSKCPKETLAEKRYKVERPKTKKVSSVGEHSTMSSGCPVDRLTLDTSRSARAHSVSGSPIRKTSTASTRKISSEQESQEEGSANGTGNGTHVPPRTKSNHFLSRRDRILLEQSWKKTRKTGADHVGTKIFFMVLTAQPDIKPIFGLEKIPNGRLKYDPRFRQHALVYTKTLDFVVRNLDYPGKLETYFVNLGRRHVAMQGRGFEPDYWETFAECMTQAAVEWEANRQRPTLGAWRALISTIISFMRVGFDEENSKKKLFTQNLSNSARARRSLSPYTAAVH